MRCSPSLTWTHCPWKVSRGPVPCHWWQFSSRFWTGSEHYFFFVLGYQHLLSSCYQESISPYFFVDARESHTGYFSKGPHLFWTFLSWIDFLHWTTHIRMRMKRGLLSKSWRRRVPWQTLKSQLLISIISFQFPFGSRNKFKKGPPLFPQVLPVKQHEKRNWPVTIP